MITLVLFVTNKLLFYVYSKGLMLCLRGKDAFVPGRYRKEVQKATALMAFPMSPGATKRNLHSVHKNGWMDAWMDRRMGGWINGQADEMIYGYG